MISLNRLEDSPESNANVTHPFDERKPRIPYVKGWHFTVQNHTPPRPTVNEIPMSCEFKNREDAIKVERLHPIERCLQYPPLPGSYSSCSLELQIRGTIRIGDRHHSQVVLVEVIAASPSVNGLSQGQCVVAKLYDPMYIDDDEFFINPFLVAEKGYTFETATYMDLSDLQGSSIPRYYGSYSLDIPLGSETTDKRSVRLILIEFIPGLSMQKTDPDQFPQENRQNIMKFLVEFETLVYSRDILLRDLHPRNVMVTTDGHVVVIDFADADIGWGALSAQSLFNSFQFHRDNYVPPLVRWHEDQNLEDEFYDWIDWDWQPWLQKEFADTAESITPGMLEFYMSPLFFREIGDDVAEGLRLVVGG